MVIHALNMAGAIFMYSNRLLHSILSPDAWLTPRTGSVLLEVCKTSGGFFFIWAIRLLGRKTLLVLGHIFIAANYIGIGILNNQSKGMLAFYAICLYYVGY